MLKKIPGYILIFLGICAVILSFAVDFVGLSDPGFGPRQRNLLYIGIFLSLAGIVLSTSATYTFARQTLLTDEPTASFRERITSLLTIAIWFGLMTGLVEGIGFLILERFVTSLRIWIELQIWTDILWIAPLINTLLSIIAALILAGISRLFPRVSIILIAAWLFAFGAAINWFTLAIMPWNIHAIALIVLSLGASITFIRWFQHHQGATLRLWRLSIPILAILAVIAFVGIRTYSWNQERSALSSLPPAEASLPNVLIIVIDTLRADHLSSYGYNRPTSPTIDRIAQEGVLFEATVATSSWTAPSHASLLMGGYSNEHGVHELVHEKTIVNDQIPVLPEMLMDRGYRTGAFSANPIFFTRTQGFGRGFTRFEDYFHSINNMFGSTIFARKIMDGSSWWWENYGPKPHPRRKLAPTVTHSALRWIKRDTERPFFAFLNYFDVHAPYQPPEPYRTQFIGLSRQDNTFKNRLLDSYDGSIAFVDAQIGQLLADIEAMQLDRELLVIITSDHGEAFGEHGSFGHAASLYREEIYVPLIIRYPGEVPSDTRISRPVTIASVPSTILELTDSDTSVDLFSSPSLVALWEDQNAQDSWPLPLSEMGQKLREGDEDVPSNHGAIRSLLSNEWHYIEHEVFGTELYDWQSDPLEEQNIAESPQGQQLIPQFQQALQSPLASFNP